MIDKRSILFDRNTSDEKKMFDDIGTRSRLEN
jgi:hypothetical protein